MNGPTSDQVLIKYGSGFHLFSLVKSIIKECIIIFNQNQRLTLSFFPKETTFWQ